MKLEDFMYEGDWIKTIRYYNDMTWYTYSVASVIPLLIVAAYRYMYPLPNIEQYSDKLPFPKKKGLIDYAYMFMFLAPYIYFIEIILTLLDGSYFQYCRFPFFYHHIVSIYPLFGTTRLNYIPWWVVLFAAWHGILLTFPKYIFLNYPYLGLIFLYHYKLYQKPYNQIFPYVFTRKIFIFFYVAVALLSYTGCENVLPAVIPQEKA